MVEAWLQMVEGDSGNAVIRELMLHAEFLKLLAKREEESDLLEQKMDMLASLCKDDGNVCFVSYIANAKYSLSLTSLATLHYFISKTTFESN